MITKISHNPTRCSYESFNETTSYSDVALNPFDEIH